MTGHWTTEEISVLCDRYPNERTEDIAESLGRSIRSVYNKVNSLGLKKTKEYLSGPMSARLRGDSSSGAAFRFKAGHSTWNKGTKGLMVGGEETRFQKGNLPHNHRPIGSTRICRDGYQSIKIAEPKTWKLTHHHVWERAGKSIPKEMYVRFKDGNKLNFSLDNLELVSQAEMRAIVGSGVRADI